MSIAMRGTSQTNSQVASPTLSVTLSSPQQPQAGDVLYIVHHNDFYALSNMPTPTVGGSTTGVTAVATGDGGTNEGHIKTYRFVVGSTGDLTVAVTETGTADEEKLLSVTVYSGVDNVTPIDGTPGGASGVPSVSHVAPSIPDIATSDAFLICNASTGGGASGGNYTPPGSMTEQYDVIVGGAMSTTGATQQLAASGATGTRTFTASSAAWVAVSAALRTAGSGGSSALPRLPLVVPNPAVLRAGWY